MADGIRLNVGTDGELLGTKDDGTYQHQTGIIKDPESDHRAHVSHFGVLKAGPTVLVLKGNFPGTALKTKVWESIIQNSASLTVADGMAQLASGTNTAGSIKIKSRKKGRFEAGQVTVFQSGVRAGTAQASNVRIWGLMTPDEQEGLYFKWNGATFQVVARKAGSETAVASGSFNGDSSFTPADTNTTYRIEYSAGWAIFYAASGGLKNILHEMTDNQAPLVNDLDMGIYYENTNSGNTTDKSMYVRGASISVWGSLASYNSGSGHITASFEREVALDNVPGYLMETMFGRNPDIDTGDEDIWNGGDDYTGFNATTNQNIEALSADANDVGTEVSSGTATGGTQTTIVDSGATFSSDGVVAGDVVVNDTVGAHGVVQTVDSETQLTIYRLVGDLKTLKYRNNVGDTYRVVTSGSTGAALMRVTHLLDDGFAEQTSAYIVLNGTSTVTLTGTYMRCPDAEIILAGSTGSNEGAITIRQASTGTIFAVMPATYNKTVIGARTVPAGKIALLGRVRASITRASGSGGSGTILLLVRRTGEVFRAVRAFEVQTGAGAQYTELGGEPLPPCTDFKFRVDQVSDTNTIADAAVEYILMDDE